MSEALYNNQILRLKLGAEVPARLLAPQASVTRVSPVCGSKIIVDLDLDDTGRVAAFGVDATRVCTLGQAAAMLVAADIIGSDGLRLHNARATLAAWLSGTSETPPDWPGFTIFAPARPHRARHPSILLTFDAGIAAMAAAVASLQPAA